MGWNLFCGCDNRGRISTGAKLSWFIDLGSPGAAA